MVLVPVEIELNKIMLDPTNPRFMSETPYSQAAIQKRMLDTREAKELLSSMKEGIKWVNRIVVRKTTTITSKIDYPEIDDFEYIVVEGNNRTACLKTGQINNITESTCIPVLEAIKETDESDESYYREIHLTQGIANVMVVKEWPPIAKARHLFKMHLDKKNSNPSLNMLQINKQISNELGLKMQEVRQAVIRFALHNEVAKESTTLDENKWPYLEAFDINQYTRNMFGLPDDSIDFEWYDESNLNDDIETKRELLNEIPAIIKKAETENIFSKEMRKCFRNFVEKQNGKTIQDIRDEIIKINTDPEMGWRTYFGDSSSDSTDEQLWNDKLDVILKDLNNFPSGADWAANAKDKLSEINKRLGKHLKIIEIIPNE
jgi:hypothetical protein